MSILLSDLLHASGGRLYGESLDAAWEDFCHDSRLARPGQIFVALRTPTGDGHDHILEAVTHGCTGVICQTVAPDHPHVTTILVPDTGDALRAWAGYFIRRMQPMVIAITGSSGKTTAKELTADLLERAFPGQVFRTRDSYNDRLGIPLALGRLRQHHRYAVLELGTDAIGEIAELAALVRPRLAAITVIGDTHIGTFGSLEAIANEKLALLHFLTAEGMAILNADDPWQVPFLLEDTRPHMAHAGNAIADIQLSAEEELSLRAPSQLRLSIDGGALAEKQRQLLGINAMSKRSQIDLETRLVGAHQLVSVRTAIAIALLMGVDLQQIQAGVKAFHPLPGRMHPLEGVQDSILLDDSYSASPSATRAALQTLTLVPAKRIMVLGEHSGLGADARSLLEKLGRDVYGKADYLITVGQQSQAIAKGAVEAGMLAEQVIHADTPIAAADLARPLLDENAVCLLKGSREARLERTTAGLMAHPEQATRLLPRQDPAWRHLRLRNTLRPTWVEVDTLALADNLRAIKAGMAPDVKVIAVLKADAYGHGAPLVARIVAQSGADILAVACLPEAQVLRQADVTLPILLLGYTPPWQVRSALELDLTLTLYDYDVALAADQAAAALNRSAPVHVKVDTGMGRLGLLPDQVLDFLRFLQTLEHVTTLGLFTHMAIADEPKDPHTELQLTRFQTLLESVEQAGLRPPMVHVANTATLLTRPDAHFDAVRLGIGLYGLAPAPGVALPPELKPALAWKTTIAQVKTLSHGSPVGYGLTYRTEGDCTIAIIPVGYADGFRRAPANWGHVLVRGHKALLVGRVSMDQAAIDVTEISGVKAGDEVVLIGQQGARSISADDVAVRLGTINYEVISAILARVPRMPE